MTEDKLLNQAELCGFDHACIIETDQLIFDSRFRQFCETNYCGNYDNNYSCPPACGTPEELKEKALKFSHALVLQTITPVKNIMDDEETKIIKHHHNEMTWDFIQKVEEELPEFLPAMAGPCGLCSPCAKKEGKPCRFPEKKASCLSAYCVQVDAMAKACGMEYYCEGEVAFFSLLFFDGKK